MKTAELVDTHDHLTQFCELPFLKFGRVRSFWGPIATVKCFEDNVVLKGYLQEPGDGRIMVVDGGGSKRLAILGDQIASLLEANGWAGIVINGTVRDSAEIDTMNVGVFCLATSPKKSAKDGAGGREIPVSFGGVEFKPGDYVYCDADGVLVSSAKLA